MSTSSSLSILQSLFTWIWQSSLAGAIAILFIGLFQMVFRKWLPARLAYLLWSCALLRLLLPITPSSHFSLFNLLPQTESTFQWRAGSTQNSPPSVPIVHPPVASPIAPEQLAPITEAERALPTSSPPRPLPVLSLASLLWLLGTLTYLSSVIARHRRLSAFLRHQKPVVHQKLQDCIEEGMRLFRLRHNIQAYEVRNEQPPAIFGSFHPRLLISVSVLDQLSEAELRLLVLHELAHVARRDVLLNWLTILLQALHWFNPFVWLGINRWRTAREAVCDVRVLSLLNEGDRHTYGTMLLKMASNCLTSSAPGLVPIFRTKKEIHRRITMIAQFKPATRLAVLGSTAVLALVAIVTLTGAGEKPTAPPTTAAPAAPSGRTSDEKLTILKKALAEQTDRLEARQHELNALGAALGITDDDEKQQFESASAPIRKLENLRIEANADRVQLDTLVKQMQAMTRNQLRKAMPTIAPDQQLNALQESFALAQQKLADLSDQYASEHPEVKRVRALLATIDKQINERLDGILEGLKARAEAANAKLSELEKQLARASHSVIEKSANNRRYYNLKRDLETQSNFRDRLQARLQEEQINALLQDK